MKLGAARIARAERLPITENESAGGSTETEATLDAVSPTGPRGPPAAITATPVGYRRKASFSRSPTVVSMLLNTGSLALAANEDDGRTST
ncbi:hypothetical protein Q0Z83_090290 [Actinoplanes sichuanensis]|nr:hypothetical protein Q0Z83_090290 [Actinoplanes sichuanensis]